MFLICASDCKSNLGLLLMIEKLFLLRFLNKTKILGHVYLILSMFISFIIFDMGDMSQVWHTIKARFGFGDLPFTTTESLYLLRNYCIILAVAIVGATPAVKTLVNKLKHSQKGSAVVCIAEPVVLTLLLAVITAFLVDGSFNPFLYFRF